MRSFTVPAVLLLLAIAFLGFALVCQTPYTPEDANAHAEAYAGGHNDNYYWKCPRPDGSLTAEKLEMHVDPDIRTDVFRSATPLVTSAVLLVDPDDPYVKKIAEHIDTLTSGYSEYLRACAALFFVQTAITYVSDSTLYGCEEYWATPSETLRYHAGDCEDTTVLFISILQAMGIRCVLLDYPGHEAAGLLLGDAQAQDYLYCETTANYPLRPGIGEYGTPEIYLPGEPCPEGKLNAVLADYRDIIKRVTGA